VANRERIVAAATDVFRRDGFDVGVSQIAREAGINVATLYRNFPSKTALILAIGSTLIESLATVRDAVLASDEPDVLGRFLAAEVELYRENRGLADALRGGHDPEAHRELQELAEEILEPVVARSHQDGSLAPHLDVADLLVALRMLHGAIASADTVGRDPQTYLDVLRTGLRTAT
jgi:AcrR family transcriptional regulator